MKKREVTRESLLSFIEWAVERADEEAPHAGGMAGSFLRALAEDGRALLQAAAEAKS